jgi:hypothetical protein
MEPGFSPRAAASSHPISRLLDRLAVLLPAQGPISIFIHHNPLHAFEHHTFEQAVVHAAERLGSFGRLPRSGLLIQSRRSFAHHVTIVLKTAGDK